MRHHLKFFIKSVPLVFAVVSAHAGLLLSGSTVGFFESPSSPTAVVSNSSNGLGASFRTGIPVAGSFQSGVKFSSQGFQNVGDGDTFSLGSITYYNGITHIGTSSGSSLLDLYLNFADPAVGKVHIATIKFGIEATQNCNGNLSPDTFSASFLQPPSILLGDNLVKFTINGLPASTLVAENNSVNLANITVTVLIPETSTFAAILGVAAFVFILIFRSQVCGGATRSLAG